MIIGQANLLKKLDSYNINTLPKALLLIGEEGCGKKVMSKYLADRLNLKLVNIKEKLDPDKIIEYQYCINRTMFVIDLRDFLTKEGKNQNNFLKFIEEPGKNAYIVLLANSEVGILPTILNRCTKLYFESYTIEELKKSQWLTPKDNDLLYKVCRTPGQLQAVSEEELNKAKELCELVLNTVSQKTYAETLGLLKYINDKKHEDRVSLLVFLNTLIYLSYEKYVNTQDNIALIIYKHTTQALQNYIMAALLEEHLIINLLLNIWEEVNK